MKEVVFEGDVYAFKQTPTALATLRAHLARELTLADPSKILIVGSAKTGFSLAPDTFLRAFSEESDIDVVVIDTAMFDDIWATLRKWHYLRPDQLQVHERGWARDRINDVFWGWFSPDRIRFRGLGHFALKSLRDQSARWFNAFRSLSRFAEFRSRDVTGRLYRSLEYAMEYHVWSLEAARNRLKGQTES